MMRHWHLILLVWGLAWGICTNAVAQRQEGLFELVGDQIVHVVVTTTLELPDLPVAPPRRELPKMVLEANPDRRLE